MSRRYYCKKDIIILITVLSLFRLIEEIAPIISDIYLGEAYVILLFELIPIVLVIALYSYRKYSYLYCWEYPALFIMNLIEPIFWTIIYNFYNGYAPHILKYYFFIKDFINWGYIIILLSAQIRYKRYKTKQSGDGSVIDRD